LPPYSVVQSYQKLIKLLTIKITSKSGMITIKLATQLLRSGVHTAGLYADGHMQPLI